MFSKNKTKNLFRFRLDYKEHSNKSLSNEQTVFISLTLWAEYWLCSRSRSSRNSSFWLSSVVCCNSSSPLLKRSSTPAFSSSICCREITNSQSIQQLKQHRKIFITNQKLARFTLILWTDTDTAVYLLIIQQFWWILLLQGRQCVL